MDLQTFVDSMGAADRRTRSNYHLTLGKLIERLKEADARAIVVIDENGRSPGEPMSYRGYYADLAFPENPESRTVEQVLGYCERALDKTYEGYKGGYFVMDAKTPLWVAEYGSCGRAIVDLTIADDTVILQTKEIE